MKRHIKKTPLLIAAALAAVLSISSLMAYLVDKDVFNHTFTTASSLDIAINTDDVDDLIVHGQELSLNPTITNNSDIPAFVFAEVDADGFDVQPANGWSIVDGTTDVYMYDGELAPGGDVAILSSLTLEAVDEANVETGEQVPVTITAYGIQSAGYEDKAPEQIWADAQNATTP